MDVPSYELIVDCAVCGKACVPVVAPPGHEDHAHIRCETCSPPWFKACVHVNITRREAPSSTDQ